MQRSMRRGTRSASSRRRVGSALERERKNRREGQARDLVGVGGLKSLRSSDAGENRARWGTSDGKRFAWKECTTSELHGEAGPDAVIGKAGANLAGIAEAERSVVRQVNLNSGIKNQRIPR